MSPSPIDRRRAQRRHAAAVAAAAAAAATVPKRDDRLAYRSEHQVSSSVHAAAGRAHRPVSASGCSGCRDLIADRSQTDGSRPLKRATDRLKATRWVTDHRRCRPHITVSTTATAATNRPTSRECVRLLGSHHSSPICANLSGS